MVALLRTRPELLSSVAPPESWIILPEFSVPAPKFTSEFPVTVSVPLIAMPPFALTAPPTPVLPTLDVPNDVKRPWMSQKPLIVSAAPFKVRAFRNCPAKVTLSEVEADVLERTKLLAASKLLTDC